MSQRGRFAFLPHVQSRLAGNARPVGGERLGLRYDIEISANGEAEPGRLPISAVLRGPGDIISLERKQISRVEPAPGLQGFETDYFPFVEFADPDLPWRYSLDTGAARRKKPWLVLIVLKPDEFEYQQQGHSPLPAIRVRSVTASLPDLNESWALAHVQVNLDDTGSLSADEALAADPAAGFARLMCPRRLDERQAYTMFLVPSYRAGVAAGLGQDPAGIGLGAPAWDDANTDIVLPFYYSSRFSTDTGENLEQLLRRLRATQLGTEGPGGELKTASSAQPGYYSDYSNQGATFKVQAALVQPDTPILFETEDVLVEKLADTLGTVISGETEDDDKDPLVAMPAYGFRFRQETELFKTRAKQNKWFDRVNLDLKMRHAAALGARCIFENQEDFAAICWRQYEAILDANVRLARLRVSQELVKRVTNDRLGKLDAATALMLAEPLQDVARVSVEADIAATFRKRGVPRSFLGRTIRRQAAKRPVTAHHDAIQPGTTATKVIAVPKIPGTAGHAEAAANAAFLAAPAAVRKTSDLRASNVAGAMGDALQALVGRGAFKGQVRPRGLRLPIGLIEPARYVARINSALVELPAVKAQTVVHGLTPNETQTIDPIYRSPIIPLPLSTYLTQIEPDAILTGGSGLADNTVSIFDENRRFVEAFLIGANHAMNDELRWRGFPNDMRGTIFRRFWNRNRSPGDSAGDDIAPIHEWDNTELGANVGPADADHESNLVLVIHGDVVRKLDQPIVSINVAPPGEDEWKKDAGVDFSPVFSGKLGSKTLFFGFDTVLDDLPLERSYLIVYEAMGRLRLGLDVANVKVRAERLRFGRMSLDFPILAMGRSYDTVPFSPAGPPIPPPDQPQNWSDLSWSHMDLTPARYVKFGRNLSVPDGPDLWGTDKTSASLARSFWQKPLAAALPMERVINA